MIKAAQNSGKFDLHVQSRAGTLACVLLIVFFLTGCSSLNCTRLENFLGANTNLISFSYSIAESLTERSMPPLVPNHPNMPILVTTFVNNDDLTQTSRFTRILQEHIISRLVQLDYAVKEIKLADTLNIQPGSGETILSRDLSQLSGDQQAQSILMGTISHTDRTLYISARLINPTNHNIIASDDYQICMDDNILAMFKLQRLDGLENPIQSPNEPFLNSIF